MPVVARPPGAGVPITGRVGVSGVTLKLKETFRVFFEIFLTDVFKRCPYEPLEWVILREENIMENVVISSKSL